MQYHNPARQFVIVNVGLHFNEFLEDDVDAFEHQFGVEAVVSVVRAFRDHQDPPVSLLDGQYVRL